MSDEVPVCDVLLEAAEYLCKLGVNLRLRSENLKEKRITKDKLKNTHAVQKTADKLLLICELSKKSLCNVENGVKKILTACGLNTIDSITESCKREDEVTYIQYGSSRLKMKQKINFKHFASVQVTAERMSLETINDIISKKSQSTGASEEQPVEIIDSDNDITKENDDVPDCREQDTKLFPKKAKKIGILDSSSQDSDGVQEKDRRRTSSKSVKEIEVVKKDEDATGSINLLSEENNSKTSSTEKLSSKLKGKSDEFKNQEIPPTKSDGDDVIEGCLNKEKDKIKEKSKEKTTNSKKSKNDNKHETEESKTNKSKTKLKRIQVIEDSSSSDSELKENGQSLGGDRCDNEEKNAGPKETCVNEIKTVDKTGSDEKSEINVITDSSSDAEPKKPNEENTNVSEKIAENEITPKNTGPKETCVNQITKADKTDPDKNSEINVITENSSDAEQKPNEENTDVCEKIAENEITPKNTGPKETCVNQITKADKTDPDKNSEINVITENSSDAEQKPNEANTDVCDKIAENEITTKNIDPKETCVNEITRADKTDPDKNSEINVITESSSDAEQKPSEKNTNVCEEIAENKITTKKVSEKPVEISDVEEESSIIKPLLKCVDISKLLKTDTVNKQIDSVKNTSNKKKKLETSPSSKQNQTKESNDDEYWKQKRKEVSAFQPKTCVVKICKLPKFTNDFLLHNKLNRITSNSKILAEVSKKKRRKTPDTVNEASNNKKARMCKEIVETRLKPEINKAKSALLIDSDSDKESNKKRNICSKKDLLNDSSSDKESNKNRNICSKEDLLNDSSSDENLMSAKDVKNNSKSHIAEEESATNKDNIEVTNSAEAIDISDDCTTLQKNINNSSKDKCSEEAAVDKTENQNTKESSDSGSMDDNTELVKNKQEKSEKEKDGELHKNTSKSSQKDIDENKSSDEISKTPSPKRKKTNSESAPQSKRKHIMESMHAKKMLLTYSSSSDTDDEQLRSALKEIKDALLEVSDDEQSMSIKERMRIQRNVVARSSSEEKVEKRKKSKKRHSVEIDHDSTSSHSKMGRTKGKPNASCSQNSDVADTDKDVDRLTNMKSLNKKSLNTGSSAGKSEDPRRSKRMVKKVPKELAIPDVVLEADSNSSDAASTAEDIEDLPTVALSGLNGDGDHEHFAKDDLLQESDASSSQNKSSEELKNDEESTEEENVKSRRRKAAAISSDSESGQRKARDPDARMSDFEDSETEASEPSKRGKRKKKIDDSDESAGSDDGGKKKRRRIKQLDDSEGSGSESETEGRKHGRKNIRKVMGKDQLEEATKKAAREEKERVARIAERQRMYNNLQFDESGKPDEVTLDKVVLDFDPETKEPLIEVDRGLVKKLKPHQANGIKFMWDACFESVKRIKKGKGSGCILAHCMGLGKTLQVVSLTHTLLTHTELTGVRRVLVVCPLSTVLNWVNEFTMWLKHAETEREVDIYELSRYKQNSERAYQLQSWFNHGGVCVLGYEMFRNLSADNSKKYKKKMLQSFQQSLVEPGPDLVVCDEGHLLKNEKTSLSQSMNRVRTLRRIVLTGTPLQNNLKEYYCMVQFVKPNLLGKYNEYLNRFVNPITNGQYTDSTEHDIRIMKRRSHVLHKMLDGAVQRRDYGVLAPFLPPKHEYVLFITLTDIQTKLYQFYLDNYSRRPLPGKSSGFLFPDFQSLQRIWTHPLVLKYNSERYEIMQQKKRDKEEEEDSEGSLADFIDDDSTPDETSTEESSDDLSDASDDSRKKKKKKSNKKTKEKGANKRRGTRANPVEPDLELQAPEPEEAKNENPTEWWIKLVSDDELDDLKNSHKLVLLFEILRQCEAIGDKLLVFSQSLYSLDLIEHFLGKIDEATQEGRIDEKLGGHVGSWSPGIDYFRLDGSTSCEHRSIWCKNFNREDNPRARLFLISTRAGGLGINLVAANRVVIFDVSWNPSHDVQSIFRVYRFGQKKPCYIYRFLAMGTMEEKIYERQVTKQAISKRVIDEQQIDRHYAENDLAELYRFEPTPATPRELPPLPKDRLFAEMLKDHHLQIYKYHEHDSLLENKEEETLTEEERKAAWEDFENEKNRPPPVPFTNMWTNGANLMVQQQQLAYAALATMLRKDMPNLNENQLRDMLPLIYNANPGMFGGYDYGLMQKMSEIYKYAQPGMGNPMINSMMNAAAGAGGALPTAGGGAGGTSGLQYSPPWQRHQHNQLRLQQLMQNQAPMNAKYYAGGLGSRDPVAMALQHARARQMMTDGGRPRGRPPHTQPTVMNPQGPAPPAGVPHTPTDVVNLDSD